MHKQTEKRRLVPTQHKATSKNKISEVIVQRGKQLFLEYLSGPVIGTHVFFWRDTWTHILSKISAWNHQGFSPISLHCRFTSLILHICKPKASFQRTTFLHSLSKLIYEMHFHLAQSVTFELQEPVENEASRWIINYVKRKRQFGVDCWLQWLYHWCFHLGF